MKLTTLTHAEIEKVMAKYQWLDTLRFIDGEPYTAAETVKFSSLMKGALDAEEEFSLEYLDDARDLATKGE